MTVLLKPRDAGELQRTVAWALNDAVALDIEGRGSKRAYGPPHTAAHTLSLAGIEGVVDYQPEELVITVRAGTALREVEALLAQRRQMLAFEPPDLGAILGGAPGEGSLAGVLMCNLAGPRRIAAGAARDHFLGFQGVNGRAEPFKAGGKMVKNVTGYDLSKLMAGSLGTLAALDEITVKVVPAPEKVHTLLLVGLDDQAAVAALCDAMGSPHEVSGAAHLPASLAARSGVDLVAQQGGSVTAIRVEGVAPSVAARLQALRAQFAASAPALEELHTMRSRAFWDEVRNVGLMPPTGTPHPNPPPQGGRGHESSTSPLVGEVGGAQRRREGGSDARSSEATLLWKISCPPTDGARVVAAIRERRPDAQALYDWSGGLVWLSLDAAGSDDGAHVVVRAALAGGHATLVRAPEAVRARVPVFQPRSPALVALSHRVKESFDPTGIFSRGRLA
ncbi:FAD-binding protein [Reyranella sp. CPCC 100927]|uniref:FAD-binding protein n=1 Tax=Reyranella sp. CPCC 100927 TaxID=2599616 RepID=UPI0011B73B23|nr:FAD-binding protein [Reyranella sp. CPCC 100927]TWT13681.1 FAD-binding protein [Reyranella sp. CPCC 100927]